MPKIEQKKRPRPVVLVILDGWGIYNAFEGNAISLAKTPVIDDLIQRFPATVLTPADRTGKGEGDCRIGHQVLGTGIKFETGPERIARSIKNLSYFKNDVVLGAVNHAVDNNSKLHFLCPVADNGGEISVAALFAAIKLAGQKNVKKLYLHLFLDGSGLSHTGGIKTVKRIEKNLNQGKTAVIASITGGLYALDRSNNWERTEKAYRLLAAGAGNRSDDAAAAIAAGYKNKIYDEEFPPTIISPDKVPAGMIEDNDAVIFFNLKADQGRGLVKAFTESGFDKFIRPQFIKNLYFATLIECGEEPRSRTVFPEPDGTVSLSAVIADNGFKQLKVAAISRLGQLAYFFNGRQEGKSKDEDRETVPSITGAKSKYSPEQNIRSITSHAVKAVERGKYDFIAVNYPDIDQAGHSGDVDLTVKAIEALDANIKRLVKAVLEQEGLMFMTSDHGNVESMLDFKTEEREIKHTSNPLPLMIIGSGYEGRNLGWGEVAGGDLSLASPQGGLADVAPTILSIMDLPIPEEMTGKSLV